MQQIDLAFLINIGSRMRSIMHIDSESSSIHQYSFLLVSQSAIHDLVFNSVYSNQFHASLLNSATNLLDVLRNHIETVMPTGGGPSVEISAWDAQQLKNSFGKFEVILESELQSIGAYIITQKGGFVTSSMIENGAVFFPQELNNKVPNAISDIKQAMRCIALESPTAAGFHLHRANEAVLRAYWDNVTSGKPRPKQGNMGVYLAKLKELKLGKESTLNQLQSLKDFHRNPLMHPEQSIDTVDDAIDLMSAIRCSIGYMLKEIIE